MRISSGMIYQQSLDSIDKHRRDASRLQNSISSGVRLHSLGDDTGAVRNVLRAEAQIRDVENSRKGIDDADRLLAETDSNLDSIGKVTDRILELTVQFANDTYSAADRAEAVQEIRQIRSRMVELANTQSNGRYLFGGLGSGAAPYDAAGVFTGDTGALEIPVGRGATVEATVSGGQPFEDPNGGPSIFTTMDNLETALATDDGATIGAVLDEVHGHITRISETRQEVGHRFERIETLRGALDRAELSAASTLADERDTDLPSAVLALQQSELGLQAALQITSRLSDLNLMNFL